MQLQGHRLPSCSNYEGAKHLWEKAAVIKGTEVRGLVNKYEPEKAVFMEGEDVCFRYHQTVLVRWVNAGTVIIHHHDSVSSRTFINRFLPRGLVALSLGGTTAVNCVEPKHSYTTWRFQPDKNEWDVDVSTAHIREDVVVDRKIASMARRKMAPYQDWKKTVEALRGEHMALPHRAPSMHLLNDLKATLSGPEIPPMEFWRHFNIEDLDIAAATVLGAVSVKEIGPYQIPGKSKYRKFMSFVQES